MGLGQWQGEGILREQEIDPAPLPLLYSDPAGKVPSEDAQEEIGIQVHRKGSGGMKKGKART